MKKKLLAFLAITILGAALITGCGGGSAAPDVPEEPSIADSIVVEEGSMPPLDKELLPLYEDAYKIYYQTNMGLFDYDEADIFEKDGFEYYRILDSRFQTYDDFRTYLLQYFTEHFVDNSILSPDNIMYTKGENGGLYFLNAARGTNIFYAGHTFAIDKAEGEDMGFKATAYYKTDAPYEGEYFYEAPADPENYSTQEYLFTMWKDDGAWRFNTFYLFF